MADFGIALALSAAAGGRMTETGLSLGTPHYMSPEQATAEKDLTHRSDIYSLGSVLYEMLTGEPPHMGSSAIAVRTLADACRREDEGDRWVQRSRGNRRGRPSITTTPKSRRSNVAIAVASRRSATPITTPSTNPIFRSAY